MSMDDAWEQRILANCPALPTEGARERLWGWRREGNFSFLFAFCSCQGNPENVSSVWWQQFVSAEAAK